MLRGILKLTIFLSILFALASNANARKVNVAIAGFPTILTFATAKERGYYLDEGLEVDFILMSAALNSHAVASRNVDFSTVGGTAIATALRGLPLRILFTTFKAFMASLYAKQEIQDIKALKGKKVGVSGIGSASELLLREILKRHGLESGRDVTLLTLGGTPTRFAALQRGVIDATLLGAPHNFTADEAGFRELVNFSKEDLVQNEGNIVVHEDLLRSDPLLIDKFTRATLKGFMYARDNRIGSIPIVARLNKVGQEVAAKMYDTVLRPAMTSDGTMNEEAQRRAIESLVKMLGVKEVSLERIFDYRLTKRLNAEFVSTGWKP
jgi:NitT/TauT family transport system substrate-binding protein